jgi:hypothetical protein
MQYESLAPDLRAWLKDNIDRGSRGRRSTSRWRASPARRRARWR